MDLKSLLKQIDVIESNSLSIKQYISESVYNTPEMSRHWKRLDEGFFKSYDQYLLEVALSPEQIQNIFNQVAASAPKGAAPADATKAEKIVDKILPDSQAAKLEQSLPEPDAGPVNGFEQKAQSAVQNLPNVDSSTKQSLMQWVKAGVKKPETQQLILAALSAGLGGLISKVGPILSMIPGGGPVVSAVTGALVAGTLAVASAKMRGEDWKSAFKGAIKPALMGGAAAVVGNLAASAIGALTGGGQQAAPSQSDTAELPGGSIKLGMEVPGLEPGAKVTKIDSATGRVEVTYPDGGRTLLTRDQVFDYTGQQGITPQPTGPVSMGATSDVDAGVRDSGSRQQGGDSQLLRSTYEREFINKYAQDPANPSAQIMQMAKNYAATRMKTNESVDRKRLTKKQTASLLSEGIFDFFKGGKKAAAGGQITADSLMAAWKAAGSPTDSEEIKALLTKQGIDATAVDKAISAATQNAAKPAAQINTQDLLKQILALSAEQQQQILTKLKQA